MLELVLVLLVFVVIALVVTIRRGRDEEGDPEPLAGAPRVETSFGAWASWAPWVGGVALTAGLILWVGMIPWIATAVGILFAISLGILIHFLVARRISKLEFQLADAIDLVVSSLRAGSGLTGALEGAAREIRRPLRGHFQELLERIRLGESPEAVLLNLEARIPLESFRLFTFTLAAHWGGGGSLATTLSNVGRTIRDRVDVARRVRSQAVETQASVAGVLLVTYGLAAFMWNNDPDRMDLFVASELGSMFIGAAILLQGVGLFWVSRLTRIEV